jgi:4-amino-4-deoxy-L-arabinose transferase-like glycosyltransferase
VSRLESVSRGRIVQALVIAAAVVVGVVLRWWLLESSQGALDSDEAVWGLMARHLQHGEFPTFFWAQSYGGTIEVILTVPVFWLFGSSTAALRVVPIVLWAIAALLVWRVGRRVLDERRARVAAALFWAWSPYFVWKSTRAHGFYGAGLVLGLAAVLLAQRLRERPSRLDAATFGLVVGLGWWETPQTAILTAPAVAWLVFERREILRLAGPAVATFALGSLPWWIFNVRHHWASLRQSGDATSRPEHLHNLFSSTLPTALGTRLPVDLSWFPDAPVGVAVYGVALLGFALLLARRPPRLGLPLLTALVFPLFYAASTFTWLNTEPRYVAFVYPVLALLVAYAARREAAAAAIVLVALALAVGGAAGMVHRNLMAQHADGQAVPADFGPLIRELRQRGVDRVYASYWLAHRITFESRERVVAATVAELSSQRYYADGGRVLPVPGKTSRSEGRYPKFNRLVAQSRDAAHVFLAGAPLGVGLRRLFAREHYRVLAVDAFRVYLPPS